MTAPDLSAEERAVVERFEAADPAEESAVEKVARALYAAEDGYRRLIAGPNCHEAYRHLATAAIGAMKGGSPTEEALTSAARDLVHHIARMHDRWADMGAEDPGARNRELWAPLHRKADVVRDLIPGEEL